MQTVVQVLAPAGEVWKTTLAMPRSEVATALSITVPRSGVPGSVSVTATVLKLAALLNTESGFVVPATNAACERPRPIGSRTASTQQPGEGPGDSVGEEGSEHGADVRTRALRLPSAPQKRV